LDPAIDPVERISKTNREHDGEPLLIPFPGRLTYDR